MYKVLKLPLPPSDNRRFIIPRYLNRLILSKEHREYKKNAGLIAKTIWGNKILIPSFENQLTIKCIVYLPDKRRDGSNIEKVLKDTLKGVVYDDDKWVLIHIVKIEIDKNNPRVELWIEQKN